MQITIKSGTQTLNYTCAEPSMIISPPEKEISFPTTAAEFSIKQEDLQKVIRAAGVLQLPDIAVVGDGSTITVTSTNSKNPTTDKFSVDVGSTDQSFSLIFKSENIIKLYSSDYNVKLTSKGISKFESTSNVNTVYYIASEANSKFGE
jgi:hypothetical protein